jgi:zinc D-Ala-D-Ala carboxypeptidase
MEKRDFLKVISSGIASVSVGAVGLRSAWARSYVLPPTSPPKLRNQDLDIYLNKVRKFNKNHIDDIYLDNHQFKILSRIMRRFHRIQSLVGFGNFYLLDFDDAIKYAHRYTSVGMFTMSELNFLEMIFYEQASDYGFYGEKPIKNLTDRIPRQKVGKIPGTGNYLYKGRPLETYHKIKKALGDDVELTSGVRSVTKQFLLFLNKTYNSKGNLSRASRSLAPPGYSFHGISDFDVGQRGFGLYNFTEEFIATNVFKRLRDMGYLSLRYPRDNMLGVRFEPWHVKVNNRA